MDLQSELILSYYRKIGVLNAKHDVFLVQHVQTNAVYVMKRLAVYSRDVYERLKASPVRNMPRIIELAEDSGVLTVVEEYITGETLADILKGRKLSSSAAVSICLQLCRIIRELHSFDPPIIHRDIKPSNIIVNSDGIVKLVDMDAAKLGDGGERDTVLMGTEGYAAPEQYGFAASGLGTDIYAIGVVMAEMVHGHFSRAELTDSLWDEAVEKCTRIDPQERYRSIDELIDAVLAVKAALDKASAAGRKTVSAGQNTAPYAPKPDPYMPQDSWMIPGFRSGRPRNMIIAVLCYFICIYSGLQITPENCTGGKLVLNRVSFIILGLISIAVFFNYRNVWRIFRLDRLRKEWMRYTAAAIICGFIQFLGIGLVVLLEELFFNA